MGDRNSPANFFPRFQGLVALLAVMWGLELLDWTMPGLDLDRFGIQPRSLSGLLGIVCAPVLHSSWSHLLTNTSPFVIFGGLIALNGAAEYWLVTLGCALISGLGVWLVSPSYTITVGASGVVFGYFGYLLLRGFFERQLSSIVISVAVGFFYGSILFQVFPAERGVSWSAHFFGLLGGVMIAQFLGRRKRRLL
ncbi:MAG: rhomboid family intramembrane serine protease [Cyanobacteria bacterium P01_F01_bin.42]